MESGQKNRVDGPGILHFSLHLWHCLYNPPLRPSLQKVTVSPRRDPPCSRRRPPVDSHPNLELTENTQSINGAMPSTTRDETPFLKDWGPALRAHRASRASCAERLASVAEKCAALHGKAHPLECDECRGAIVEEIRRRYVGADGGDAWFSGREGFLKELGAMLDGANGRRVGIAEVEERIQREKVAWYRDTLRTEPYYINAAIGSVGDVAGFHRALGTAEDYEDLARMVREGIGPVRGGAIDPEAYLSLLENPDSKRDDLLRLVFGTDDGKIPDGVEPYADLYRAGTPISTVLSTINEDSAEPSPDLEARARRARDERSSRRAAARDARRRLDELERARAAHTKILSRKTEEKDKRLRTEFYSLPPCRGCGGEVEAGKVVACSLCQVEVEMGVASAQTAYCSMSCCERAHVSILLPLPPIASIASTLYMHRTILTDARNPTLKTPTAVSPARPAFNVPSRRPPIRQRSARNAPSTTSPHPSAPQPARPRR